MDLLKNLAGRAVEQVAKLSDRDEAKFVAQLLEDPTAAAVLALNQTLGEVRDEIKRIGDHLDRWQEGSL